MPEVQFLVPVRSNAGAAFRRGVHARFERHLLATFGGWTLLPGLTHGAWVAADGTVYRDRARLYSVVVSGLLARSADVLATAAFVRANYGQLAAAVRHATDTEIFE